MSQNQQYSALQAATKQFTRQIIIFAIIESLGFTIIILLYINQALSEALFTPLLIGWLVLIGIPLMQTMVKFQQKKAQLLNNQADNTSRPELISKN